MEAEHSGERRTAEKCEKYGMNRNYIKEGVRRGSERMKYDQRQGLKKGEMEEQQEESMNNKKAAVCASINSDGKLLLHEAVERMIKNDWCTRTRMRVYYHLSLMGSGSKSGKS